MQKRAFLFSLVAGVLACTFGATNADAGTVLVTQDQGTFNFTLTANGTGEFTIDYSNAQLNQINGAPIPTGSIAALLPLSAVHFVTSTITSGNFTEYTLTQPAPSTKFFGVGPGAIDTASLTYDFTAGTAVTPSFLNLRGNILSVPSPLLEMTATAPTIYDFSPYMAGGEISRTYTKVGANFAYVIAHGGTITGTGAFADLASVPEPSSIALLGIGMACVVAFRARSRWNSVA